MITWMPLTAKMIIMTTLQHFLIEQLKKLMILPSSAKQPEAPAEAELCYISTSHFAFHLTNPPQLDQASSFSPRKMAEIDWTIICNSKLVGS